MTVARDGTIGSLNEVCTGVSLNLALSSLIASPVAMVA